jgi:hypothetical protein
MLVALGWFVAAPSGQMPIFETPSNRFFTLQENDRMDSFLPGRAVPICLELKDT